MIRKLTAYKIGQAVRDDGPRSHLTKAGTPTMGRRADLVSICVTTLLWGDLSNKLLWVVLLVTLAFGSVGWIDDLPQGGASQPEGPLREGQVLLAVRDRPRRGGLSRLARAKHARAKPADRAVLQVRRLSARHDRVIVLTFFVIVGTSNAVNLTDGLDGLAIMPTVLVGSALGVFAYVAGHAVFSKYLGLPYIAGAGELA